MNAALSNNLLTIEVDSHGAELCSIVNNITGQQYLWSANPAFWARHSPVLFPIVGSLWNGSYTLDGVEYKLPQHGFARDLEFALIQDVADDEIWFELVDTPQTYAVYPRKFSLRIGYRLLNERITVMWRVKNLDERPMPFQIGAHPAFNYPEFNPADDIHAYLAFDTTSLQSQQIQEKGCVGPGLVDILLDHNQMLPLKADTFANNALIFADRQVHRVSILDKYHSPYISLFFNAPLLGIWNPSPNAPFVCIEPWWGRCDDAGYQGDFFGRRYVNILGSGEVFEAEYTIIIENV